MNSYRSSRLTTVKEWAVGAMLVLGLVFAAGGFSRAAASSVIIPSPSPVPFIQSITPVSAAPGGAAFMLTINGANFVAASQVFWGTTALTTTFVSNIRLTAVVPAPLTASNGTGWITVQSPAPGGGSSNVFYLPVQASAASVNYAQLSYAAGNSPSNIVQGDFNNDGKTDLAVANFAGGTLSIFLGNGDGTFQVATSVAVPFGSLFGMAVGDVDHDGNLDLVVGEYANTGLALLLGNGDGTFKTPVILAGGSSLLSPILADINGDGNLDIVGGIYTGTGIDLFLGNGDGTFQAATVVGSTVTRVSNLIAADLNGDGLLDLVAVSWVGGATPGVNVLLGTSPGTFALPVNYGPSGSWNLVVGDFNEDGNIDIMTAEQLNGSGFLFYAGGGDGTLAAAQVVGSGSYFSIATGDLNGDGHLDVVGTDFDSSQLAVNLGEGDGTFQTTQNFGTNVNLVYSAVVGNFINGAGLAIAAPDGSANLLVFEPTVLLTPASVNFGDQSIGSPSAATDFTVTNLTSSTVTLASIAFTGTNAGDFSEIDDCLTCSSDLAAGAFCTVHVTFTPSAAGAESGALNITDNAPASPQTAQLAGAGVATPVASLSATSLTFTGQVGTTSAMQSVTLTNTGSAILNISGITLVGANPGDFGMTTTCGAIVAIGGTCTISATFTPTVSGARAASVSIADDAADTPQAITLAGSGQLMPTATLSVSTLTYAGSLVGTTSAAQSFTITNTGGAALAITSIAITGTNAGDFGQTNNCGASVAANGTCSINVTFTPTAGAARSAAVTITDNAASSPQAVTLTGTGEDFTLVFTPTSQNVAAGATATFQLVVTPEGGFAGAVTLTCAGAPANSTCTVTPSSFTSTGAPTTVSVALVTTARLFAPWLLTALRFGISVAHLQPMLVAAGIGLLLMAGWRRKKSSLGRVAAAQIALVLAGTILIVAFGLGGCGSSSGGNGTSTRKGTYNLTVTATAGTLSHSAGVSVTVQ